MPITISGSTGIAGVDGSASTPAVQGTDTNTGIVFPAADTVTVATGGSERMRVDSSGNVGIGTTSTTANAKLAVEQGIVARASTAGLVPYLQLYNSNAGTDLKTWRLGGDSGGSLSIETVNDAYSAATQRLVINSSGILLVGTTTGLAGHTFQNSSGATTYRPTTTTGFGIHHFYSDVSGTSSLKAYVQADGTYINASDEKLKTNIVKARSYLNDLMRIEIVNYTWKGGEDNEKKLGVIAQQVESVFPSLVKEVIGSPATGETQKMLPQEVFIPMLITAIQELKADNDAMKERIATLEAK